ncbi:hypothetical protein MSIBF_A4170001 [groundwater metagenome]|uniref:Uncharacterized protein n=1 Tax=groundwater metagenome TaxID=717931 RepID=A0A098EDH0_9ZZZZ
MKYRINKKLVIYKFKLFSNMSNISVIELKNEIKNVGKVY